MKKATYCEKKFYEKFWKNLKGGYSGDEWHFSSKKAYPVVDQFISCAQKEKKKIFLDIGCGNGRHAVLFSKSGFKSFGIDLSQEAIVLAKKLAASENVKINYTVGDVLHLPYRNDQFDVVLDSGCFHHLRKYQWSEYVKNVKNVLKKNGLFFLICFSIHSDGNIPRFWNGDHKRNWTKKKGHYNHIFKKQEIEKLFNKDFDILKIREMTKGDFPLRFWVVWMRNKKIIKDLIPLLL